MRPTFQNISSVLKEKNAFSNPEQLKLYMAHEVED